MTDAPRDARLANYRLERLLGTGGMGAVYLAHDLTLDRPVAIKFISPEKAGDATARRRLVREARAAAGLDHPNICGVHEVIEDPDGRAAIVMQYVEGETLAERLRRGPLEVRRALAIAADLAAALAAAHKRGIVHRDLKPQNVILAADNRAKLLDFGLARHSDVLSSSPEHATTTNLTTAGAIVGTPAYMSPEQARQLPLDGRSDLFSLGAVLFECLTGKRAFDAGSGLEQVSQVLHHDPPPVSAVRPELGEQHDELCRRLLAKHPDDRFRSADEVLGAVRVLLPESGTSHSGSSQARSAQHRSRWASVRGARLYAALAIVAIVASAGVWHWRHPTADFEGTEEARHWYELGTGWIRDGAYHSGRRALTDAIEAAPGYVPAYVRLAEACTELDDRRAAQDWLLTVDRIVDDVGDLPLEERLRLDAVRSLTVRDDVDRAVRAYEQLANRRKNDAGALVDLGRAWAAAGVTTKAQRTFRQAIQLDARYAAAHLRLAGTLADQLAREEALEEFATAERLYHTAANVEGQIETLLRRGAFLNAIGEFTPARQDLEQARTLAQGLEHREQEIRARLSLSSVTAAEGRLTEAQDLASTAANDAILAGLDTLAAEGLIDLSNVILLHRQSDVIDDQRSEVIGQLLQRATTLADRQKSPRTSARAALQRASFLAHFRDHEGAIEVVEEQLPFLRENGFRRFELTALAILSRAREGLGNYEQAQQEARQLLKIARQLEDTESEALALENLAGSAAALGDLPAAHEHRVELERIHREQKNESVLPYDLTNRAELLIWLGRDAEADALLREVEGGIAKEIDSYVGRTRRVASLRALSAVVNGRIAEAARLSRTLIAERDSDGPAQLAAQLLAYARAHSGTRRAAAGAPWVTAPDAATRARRELRYWELTARLAGGDAKGALEQAVATLGTDNAALPPEFEWRIAALGAVAARTVNDTARADSLSARAHRSLERVHQTWGDATIRYLQRRDLADLKRKAGLK